MKRILFVLLLIVPFFTYSHELKGKASWYGGKFIGRQTANGEVFDTREYTAAHKTLPFNTVLEVINLDNGKKINVRINDRGPFIEGRVIDLSEIAAEKLDMVKTGTANVSLKILESPKSVQLMDIQVAAFSNFTYAASMKSKLKQAGFEPKTSLSKTGIMRVTLPNVPINKSYEIVKRLEDMGINNILIIHRG